MPSVTGTPPGLRQNPFPSECGSLPVGRGKCQRDGLICLRRLVTNSGQSGKVEIEPTACFEAVSLEAKLGTEKNHKVAPASAKSFQLQARTDADNLSLN